MRESELTACFQVCTQHSTPKLNLPHSSPTLPPFSPHRREDLAPVFVLFAGYSSLQYWDFGTLGHHFEACIECFGTLEKFKMADLQGSEIFFLLDISQSIPKIYGIFQSGKYRGMVYHMFVKEWYVILKNIQ